MKKRLAVYSIKSEKRRLAFGAAVHGIDPDAFDAITDNAICFKSDKTLLELHRLLVSECAQSSDEIWILSLTSEFTGNGIALNDLRLFLKDKGEEKNFNMVIILLASVVEPQNESPNDLSFLSRSWRRQNTRALSRDKTLRWNSLRCAHVALGGLAGGLLRLDSFWGAEYVVFHGASFSFICCLGREFHNMWQGRPYTGWQPAIITRNSHRFCFHRQPY